MTVQYRIVTFADGHWNQDQEYENNHTDALNLIDSIHNERAIDLLVHTGDIVHDDETVHSTVKSNFFDQIPTGVEWDVVFGNHDWCTNSEWNNIYGHDKNHSFTMDGRGFVLIETCAARDPEGQDNYTTADAATVASLIDDVASTGEVFCFQHVAPTQTYDNAQDVYGMDMPSVRQEFQRDEVKAVFLGHNHSNNFVAEYEGVKYVYGCRIGGVDLSNNTDSSEITDWGVRVFDVTDNE